MKIRELDMPQGALQYTILDGQAFVLAYRGKDTELVIPAQIEECLVTCIGKKSFLSNKFLKQITLPDSIVRIDDWAFAYCGKLKKLILPYHKMEIGQGVFKECSGLEQVIDERGDLSEAKTIDTGYLLAATMSRLDAFYLFDFVNAGSKSWFLQWDARMEYLMSLDDADGFSKMLLCGEEDYGSRENNLDYYTQQQRRAKVRLAMLRLMHPYGLQEKVRNHLEEYLRARGKGCVQEDTWRVVLEEHGDEKVYYQFLIDLGLVTADVFPDMMTDMGESHAEMKAFLMRYHSENHVQEDAFAAFEL
jgi:hypothetical protein